MREGYKAADGSELTWSSDEFAGRLQALLCLFANYGVIEKKNFKKILGEDWKWDHYCKVVKELQSVGAVDQFWMVTPFVQNVLSDIQKLAEDGINA